MTPNIVHAQRETAHGQSLLFSKVDAVSFVAIRGLVENPILDRTIHTGAEGGINPNTR